MGRVCFVYPSYSKRKAIKYFFTFFCLLFVSNELFAQIHCKDVQIFQNETVTRTLTFDGLSKYQSGITINRVATVRVMVTDLDTPDPDCSWSLTMIVNNNPGGGTSSTNWEKLLNYGGGSASDPTIDLLQVRVRNACATSPIDGVFQNFTNNGDIIDIIEPLIPVTPAGSCTQNVNGAGSYLTNYDEYNFDIDIRVIPGVTFNPGLYQLDLVFHLEQNP